MIGATSDPVIHWYNWLSKPTCGLPSMPHAMAVRIGGMKNGNVTRTSSEPRNGVSVRARIQASRTARATEGMVFASDMPTVFSSVTALCSVTTSR